ncbi:MAG: peptidylprolyl isomerase, partial [bacterium]|nr:peptidylprolyl isomerase [bacterium]
RHILMNTQGKSEQEKMEIYQKMEKILAEAKSGKDFAMLANNYSEDPGSNTRGGLYENFEQGAMVEPFDRAAFSLPVGEISDIVETQYGYHILKVLDRKKDTRPYDQVRSELLEEVKNQKRKEVVPNFIEELKQQEGFEIVSYES